MRKRDGTGRAVKGRDAKETEFTASVIDVLLHRDSKRNHLVIASLREYNSLRSRVNNNHLLLMSINMVHDSAPLSLAPSRSSMRLWRIPSAELIYLGKINTNLPHCG
jgi:hypothetical protein